MNSYLKITGRTFTIWILTSLINAAICGIFLSAVNFNYDTITDNIITIYLISLFFSIPGFFLFWMVLLINLLRYKKGRTLFRAALLAGLILSSATAFLGRSLYVFEFSTYSLIPAISIVLSTMISIMLHFKYFKNIK